MKKVRCRIATVSLTTVILLVLFVPLVLGQSTDTLNTIDEVEQETQEIRGLDELYPIDVRFMTTQELEQKLIDDLNEDYSTEDWDRDEGLLKLLGFLEPTDDYYQIMLDLYTEQVAGFYDPEEKYLALISEDTDMRAMDRMNLSHEVTHALQDQHYQLDKPPFDNPESTDYDVDFAATCLVEGDATLTMYFYQEGFTSEDYEELMEDAGDIESKKFDAAPQYIQDSLLFPYEAGLEFAQRLYDRNEFESVDKAYANLPASTEQIMHPEKYFNPDIPVKVEFPDISSALEEGWELDDTNVLGEFDIQELLMTELSKSDADDGAAGWGGCQYRYYVNPDAGGRLMAIDIVWDTEADAREFAGMFGEYVDYRYDLPKGSYELDNDWAVWDTGADGAVALSLNGNKTFVVFSSEKNPLSAAAAALGKGGEGLSGVLQSQPDLEKNEDESESSSANVMVFVLVIALLVVGLLLAIAFLVFKMKRSTAQPAGYPWPPQSPGQQLPPGQQWPPQPPQWPQQWPPQPPGQQWPQQPPQPPPGQQWPPQPPQPPPDTSGSA